MNNYKKIILNNGIPLYLYNDKSLKQVYVNYIIKYGSDGKWFDFELNNKKHHVSPGYAHYLEHVLLENSKYGNLIRKFNDKYYNTGGYTTTNHTSYYFCGANDIKNSIKQLIEAIECPVFDEKSVDYSRHAIEEESSMWTDFHAIASVNLTEKNLYGDYDVFDETLSPIGNRKTTQEINVDDLYNCYNAFYTNDKKVLVIAGNVDEKELVNYLNEIYSNIPVNNNKLIIPNYDYESIRKLEDVIYRDVEKEIYGMGIKIKKPKQLTHEDLGIIMNYIMYYLFEDDSDFLINLKDKKLLDKIHYCFWRKNDDYINFLHNFSSSNKDVYYDAFLDKINNLNMTNEEFEFLRRKFIAEEIRNLDDKYSNHSEFGYRMNYTDNYSDIDYYKNLSYDKFSELIKQIDFSTHVKTQVKKIKR